MTFVTKILSHVSGRLGISQSAIKTARNLGASFLVTMISVMVCSCGQRTTPPSLTTETPVNQSDSEASVDESIDESSLEGSTEPSVDEAVVEEIDPAEDTGSDDETSYTLSEADKVAISKDTWVSAYMNALSNLSKRDGACTLIYLNDDEIPEVVYFSGPNTAASHIYSYQMDALGGRLVEKGLDCTDSLTYKEKGGVIIYHAYDGQYYYDDVIKLKDGLFEELFDGVIYAYTESLIYAISGINASEDEYYASLNAVESGFTDLSTCSSMDYYETEDLQNALNAFPESLFCEYLSDKDGYVAQSELSFNGTLTTDNFWKGSDTFDLEGYAQAAGATHFYAIEENGNVKYFYLYFGDWKAVVLTKEFFDSYPVQVYFNDARDTYTLNRTAFLNGTETPDSTAIKVEGYNVTINKESINMLPVVIECITTATGENPYEGRYPDLLFKTDEDEYFYQKM